MTVQASSSGLPSSLFAAGAANSTVAIDPAAAGAVRLRYEAPVLRHLGNVRDLTLGGTGGPAEFGKRQPGPM
jgi:hypothetical protein